MHDLAALEQHAWVCWHYPFDGHGYHGLVEHGTMIWFTDLPSWGTYLSPHATGRLWSCSTFDWPKRCRDSGLKHCGSRVNQCWDWVLSLEGWEKTRKLWVVKTCLTLLRCGSQIWELMVVCLTLASCDELLEKSSIRTYIRYHLSFLDRIPIEECQDVLRMLPGCNMRRIAECTGAKVRIRGQGSNSKWQKWKIRSSGHPVILQNTVDRNKSCTRWIFVNVPLFTRFYTLQVASRISSRIPSRYISVYKRWMFRMIPIDSW